MIALVIYLIGIVDSLGTWTGILGVLTALIGGIGWIVANCCIYDVKEDKIERMKKEMSPLLNWFKKIFYTGTTLILICILTPDSKTIAAMALVPRLADSKTAQNLSQIPDKVTTLLNQKLDEWIIQETPKGDKK